MAFRLLWNLVLDINIQLVQLFSVSKCHVNIYTLNSFTANRRSSALVSVAAATTTTAAASTSSAVPAVFVPNSAHVLMQSESLTKYEATEMAQRLASLALSVSNIYNTFS